MSQQQECEAESVATSPAILFACMVGARRVGDLLTANIMRRELERRHDVRIRFATREGRPDATR